MSGVPCGEQCCNTKQCSLPLPTTACEDKVAQCYFGQDLSSHVVDIDREGAIYSSDSVDIGELFDSQCHADAECVDRQDTIPRADYAERMANMTCGFETNNSWVCAGKMQKQWYCGRCKAHAAIPCLVDNDVADRSADELCDGQHRPQLECRRHSGAAAGTGAPTAPTGSDAPLPSNQKDLPDSEKERQLYIGLIAGWVVVVVCCGVVCGMVMCRSKKPKTRDRGGGSIARGLLELVSPRTRGRHSDEAGSLEERAGLVDMVERGRGSDFDLIDFQSTGAVTAFSELSIGEKVGTGASGVVMRGHWRGTEVAVKRLNSMLSNEQAREFRDEIKLLIRLRHPQIIQFLGAAFHAPDWFVLTEFAERGSLDAVLADEQRIDLPWSRRVAMARDAAAGMDFLHQSQIIHRDLKSANLLVTADMRVKIGVSPLRNLPLTCEPFSERLLVIAGLRAVQEV